MEYFLVAVGSQRYHGRELLTYSSDQDVPIGSLVEVPLAKSQSLGFVVNKSTKPVGFAAKQISRTFEELNAIPAELLTTWRWLAKYYPSPISSHSQLLLPPPLPQNIDTNFPSRSLVINQDYFIGKPLTTNQQAAYQKFEASGTHVLHGETGSGKTRLYIELAKDALAQGRSSIILTPEISLTSQLSAAFAAAFGKNGIMTIHSHLTSAARRRLWLELLQSPRPRIVIGPRSALFYPVHKVGLIVLDESHEFAYKQESAPYYVTARAASQLASSHQAQLVLGSATPSIEDYYLATARNRPIIRLSDRAINNHSSTSVDLVDMRAGSGVVKKNGYFSRDLVDALAASLSQNHQSLIFLNRRGSARSTLCESCGWQALCPNCDINLTYHHDDYLLRCHTCNFSQPVPTSCPSCASQGIIMKSIGTKSIVSELQKLFPGARIARFDTDNKTGQRFHELYDQIKRGEADFIVGTQLLAKGLDLPLLDTVGIINADSSLAIPDFTSNERTYQIIHQLIGRVGRGHSAGRVILQTYNPDNPIISAASQQNWDYFIDSETKERRAYHFPPFTYLLKLEVKRASSKSAQAAAEKLTTSLKSQGHKITIQGPAPAFQEKINNKYVWQLIIKSQSRTNLIEVINHLPTGWGYDIDPINLL